MKRIAILAIILMVSMNISCKKDFFDQVPDDRLTLEETFNSRDASEKFLANVYNFIKDESEQRFSVPWTAGSDEADFVWGFAPSNNINNGTYDASSGFINTYWQSYYQAIRSASIFMANIDKVPDLPASLKTQYKAEAKALRAYFYFQLMRLYGPIILIGEDVIAADASFEELQKPRNSYDECVNYVVAEMDAAAAALPVTANTANLGRMTKSIILAYKAELLLSAASPLFNGNTDYAALKNSDGKQLINQTFDATKWKRAADAAKAFLDQFVPGTYTLFKKNDDNGNYSAYLSCRDVMLENWNKEVIFARDQNNIPGLQYERVPYHQGYSDEVRASGGLGATQNMVDAYFTANGRSIDDSASGYVSSGYTGYQAPGDDRIRGVWNAWANREPRFYVGITYTGSKWLNTNSGEVITDIFAHGNSGKATGGNDYSTTGYMVRKNVSTGTWYDGGRSLVMLRLAQLYLDYAEALNEAEPGNADILKYLNLIRERAGIPQYGSSSLPAPASQAAMREAIRKERRVELAFENVRFFDVRRWKIAEDTQKGPIKGLTVDADPPNFFNVVTLETRVFQKKHYLFPIPQADINSDKQLKQNTGW
ncbi:RagB/SusD family nutrient uptake outer membrane protein [Mucilaginibacter terrae]|uniref:RagB/SusD family nutrient uptake outer membrane protein n=1 Tax=Mucilaginibacter terrae TaxID=1955052 RepID=A0ABU3H0U1_9SPHI|nr:RagB/SusD family nutrient uptake outer membrane protein [Mucilaginibacter terrae]MDT3405306.1 hypothetical protein [Mucilaginibacter terrae]